MGNMVKRQPEAKEGGGEVKEVSLEPRMEWDSGYSIEQIAWVSEAKWQDSQGLSPGPAWVGDKSQLSPHTQGGHQGAQKEGELGTTTGWKEE